MNFLHKTFGRAPARLAAPAFFATVYFLGSQLLRLALIVLFRPPSATVSDLLLALAVGVHVDLAIAALVFLPLALVTALVSEKRWQGRIWRGSMVFGTFVAWVVLIFLLLAEGFFFEEFQSRFNTVAIDYLLFPHEVFINIWESYPVPLVIAIVVALATAVTWLGWRLAWKAGATANTGSARKPLLIWAAAVVALLLSLTVRNTRFSRERAINEIASNSFITLWTAATTHNLEYAAFYPTMPRAEAFARARRLVATPDATFTGPTNSLQRRIDGDAGKPRLNMVLLLEESLGSEFWGSLGRKEESLMPKMDALALSEGMIFDSLYADGNRTIRGYEGVFCSFPPLPGDSIVARDRSENVETIARVLQRDGYDTTFIYAGRGIFDGTGPFVKANGWTNFVELKDFKEPVFTSIWGVCNEDLYDRVLVEARERHQKGLPFFVTSMSVSNHKPFSYPTGRIAEDPKERRRGNAVKYSDYALARFFEMARKEPFWTNTIFAVVADHGARVYGSQTIPIRSYEIPMILFGPAVSPKAARVSTPGCQLDIAPTLLGLIGRPYESVFFGRDLLKWPKLPSRALVHHNRSIGIYEENRLAVFSLNKQVEYFEGNPKAEQMRRVPEADADHKRLQEDATALFQVADELYMNRQFRVEPSEPKAIWETNAFKQISKLHPANP